MTFNVKPIVRLAGFLKPLTNSVRCSRSLFGLNAFARHHDSSKNSRLPTCAPLLGASLQSLPGNRCPSDPSSLMFFRTKRTTTADTKISWRLGNVGIEEVEDFSPLSSEQLQQAITFQINDTLENGREGRLYAVVHVRSLQYKVTAGDIIIVKHDFPPNVGDKIRLEKVLAVGGSDFTLYGQPLLSRDNVLVEATVVEKTLSHNRVRFLYRKRTNWKRFHLYREVHTMLVINSVRVARLGEQAKIEESQKE